MNHIHQKCDFCGSKAIVDGKTIYGPWGFMCEHHFEKLGVKVEGLFSYLTPPMVQTKVCSLCGQEKPLEKFYKYHDGRGVERYRTECIDCNLAARKRRRFKK